MLVVMTRLTLTQEQYATAAKVTPRGRVGVTHGPKGWIAWAGRNWLWPERQELDHGVREHPIEPNADDIRYVAAPADIIGDHESWPSPGK